MKCPRCSEESKSGAGTCKTCGAPLVRQPAQPSRFRRWMSGLWDVLDGLSNIGHVLEHPILSLILLVGWLSRNVIRKTWRLIRQPFGT